ncbi:MAG: hypothetical protein JW741_19450, partial [Sedimentisphaerales bacterium]|nr:hypothetical protein [Sedimentisphaerales bacterium]
HDFTMEGGWGNAERWRDWVTKEAMLHCDDLFQQALAAVEDHADYRNHVRRAYLEVLWGSIMIDFQPGHHPPTLLGPEERQADSSQDPLAGVLPTADPTDIQRRLQLFTEIMNENQYNKLSEVVPFLPRRDQLGQAAPL